MVNKKNKIVVPGIPDELFVRGKVPLTKEEIRCLTLSKLRLEAGNRVLDIGAGSGGLSVECALLLGDSRKSDRGSVVAVERDPDALHLIKANLERFGLRNVTVIQGEAPEALKDMGQFDRIIIGGSGGKLPEIIEEAGRLLVPGGVLALNCILLETLAESLQLIKKYRFTDTKFIQAAIFQSRVLGPGTALQPLNPIFIITAVKGEH
jgi:cobalt-precorrin-6B (C15)-methyltransferase